MAWVWPQCQSNSRNLSHDGSQGKLKKRSKTNPLTIIKIAKAQNRDQNLKIYYKQNAKTPEKGMSFQLIENTKVLCKDDKLIIPASLQHRAVSWYHHYLQHPGHSRLKETMRSVMYWKGMRRTIRSYVNLAGLARWIRDTARSTDMFHQSWS